MVEPGRREEGGERLGLAYIHTFLGALLVGHLHVREALGPA
jgi:hypothetical protein